MPGITDLLTKTARQVRSSRGTVAKRSPRHNFFPLQKTTKPNGMTNKQLFGLTSLLAVTGGCLWLRVKAVSAARQEDTFYEGLSQLQPFARPPTLNAFATDSEERSYHSACRAITKKREAVLWILMICHQLALPEKTAGHTREWAVDEIHNLSQAAQQKRSSFDDLDQYQQENFVSCARLLFPELDKYKPNNAFYQMALKKLDEQLQTANDNFKNENNNLKLIVNSGVTHAR